MKQGKKILIIVILSILLLSTTLVYTISAKEPNPAADLDQLRNGKASNPVDPGKWANGNLNPQQSHYIEGYSVPYRVVMTDLPTGTPITITIGFDIKKNGKHAQDYLTTYTYIDEPPHSEIFGHAPETIGPLDGVTGVSSTTTTYPIPAPSSTNSPVSGQPTTSFNSLNPSDRVMTLMGGTITNVAYADQGDLTLDTDEAQVSITFTADSSTAVLLWGGHIASVIDWGFDETGPRSASGISGSPYHTRTVEWNLDTLGSQDRSMKIDETYGRIIIKKVIDWGYYTQYMNGHTFYFDLDWEELNLELEGGSSQKYYLLAGTYSVTEVDIGLWELAHVVIKGGGYDTIIGGPTAVVELDCGDSITITFVNRPPDFVIPENPLGTLGSIAAMMGVVILFVANRNGVFKINK